MILCLQSERLYNVKWRSNEFYEKKSVIPIGDFIAFWKGEQVVLYVLFSGVVFVQTVESAIWKEHDNGKGEKEEMLFWKKCNSKGETKCTWFFVLRTVFPRASGCFRHLYGEFTSAALNFFTYFSFYYFFKFKPSSFVCEKVYSRRVIMHKVAVLW